jgi:hypothetical protein
MPGKFQRALSGPDRNSIQNKLPEQVTRGSIWLLEIYLGYDQGVIGCSSLCIPHESFMQDLQLNR